MTTNSTNAAIREMVDGEQDTATTIKALHSAYERCTLAYTAIEKAERELRGTDDGFAHQRALTDNLTESDAIRYALLMQVPCTWTDALILQYHIWIEQDAQATWSDQEDHEDERRALSIAATTLFDFMACEIDADHESIGPDFQTGCNLAFSKRQMRTGKVEG